MNNLILITGIERSGSSIIARILHIAGINGGAVSSMYENLQIRYLFNQYLLEQGVSMADQYPFYTHKGKRLPKGIKTLFDSGIGMYKNAKLFQAWQAWEQLLPNPKWIIVRRRPYDIVESCEKTAYMHSFKDPVLLSKLSIPTQRQGWLWWVEQQEKQLAVMANNVNYFEIWPERIAMGDFSQVHQLLDWLGLPWSPKIVKEITPLMWKSKYRKS